MYGRLTMWILAALLAAGCQDYDSSKSGRSDDLSDTAWAVAYLTGFLLNEHVASQPAGRQDATIQCSQGGSIRMTGNTSYDDATAILTMDVTYAFADAHAAVAASNLVVTFRPLTGTIRQTGSMRLGSGLPYEDQTAVSTGLVYEVTIERGTANAATLAGAGPYELATRTWTNGVGDTYRRLSGELDGVAFSWDYATSSTNASTNAATITVIL